MSIARIIGGVALASLILVLSVGAAGVGWAIWQYENLAGDVGHARARLPNVVSSALTQTGGTRDSPTITLVRGYGGLATGSTLLFRSDPVHHAFSFLTIPAAISKLPATTTAKIDGPSIARLTRWLKVRVGIPVNHVALLNFDAIHGIVDALGGITVLNRRPFDVITHSQATHFPAGSLRLDGTQAAAFLAVDASTKAKHALRERNEALVLQAVIDTAIRSHDVPNLLTTAKTVADSSATDLSTSDIVGLVAVRLTASRVLNCNLSHVKALDAAQAQAAVSAFKAAAGSATSCVSRATSPVAGAAIVGAGAVALSRYGVAALVVVFLIAIGAIVAAAAIALLSARRVTRVREPAFAAYGGTGEANRARRSIVPGRSAKGSRASGGRIVLEGGQVGFGLGRRSRARPQAASPQVTRPPSPQPPHRESGNDRADHVVALRRQGLSYREIAERLTRESEEPLSEQAARQLWHQATGTTP